MEKHDYSREIDAGPVGAPVVAQGSFNPDGKQVGKPGKEAGIMGKNDGNSALNVAFPKKGEDMKGQKSTIMKEDFTLIGDFGK